MQKIIAPLFWLGILKRMSKIAGTQDEFAREAEIYGRYLIRKPLAPLVSELYSKSMASQTIAVSPQDKALLEFIRRHPWSIGLIDAGLSLVNPNSEVRRRLYTIFSILEAIPEYAEDFLPRKEPPLYMAVIVLIGIRGAAKTVAGSILVKIIA